MGKVATEDTLNKILARLMYQNAASRSALYSSFTDIARLIRAGSVEMNRLLFPIGDIISVSWKDMDDTNHNTDETAYKLNFIVAHHGMVTLENGRRVPGMYLQSANAIPKSAQFSRTQAAYNAGANGLEAGTYSITMGSSVNGYMQGDKATFTLQNAVPAYGRIFVNTRSNGAYPVQVFAKDATNAQETTTAVTDSALEAVSLGATDDGLNNELGKMRYGSNRWKTSAVRQWLNATGASWYESRESFDLPPSYHNRTGFLSGFDKDFLSAIRPVKQNTLYHDGDTNSLTDETCDKFFLPSLEQMNFAPQIEGAEGEYFEYWKDAANLDGYALTGDNNTYDCYKISTSDGTARSLHLRSALTAGTNIVYGLTANGAASLSSAGTANLAASDKYLQPVCVIC